MVGFDGCGFGMAVWRGETPVLWIHRIFLAKKTSSNFQGYIENLTLKSGRVWRLEICYGSLEGAHTRPLTRTDIVSVKFSPQIKIFDFPQNGSWPHHLDAPITACQSYPHPNFKFSGGLWQLAFLWTHQIFLATCFRFKLKIYKFINL